MCVLAIVQLNTPEMFAWHYPLKVSYLGVVRVRNTPLTF